MRVIAGTARGRRLIGPPGLGTRPMTDRAREGIFSAIVRDVPGARVVDLYAGTGSMGLEALSRGAASAAFVEHDREALAALSVNIAAVGLGGSIVSSDVGAYLDDGFGGTFDLAFVDPPYDLSLASVQEVLEALVDCLEHDALVVLHRRIGEPRPEIAGLLSEGERSYGSAQIWRYRRWDHEDRDQEVRDEEDEEQG